MEQKLSYIYELAVMLIDLALREFFLYLAYADISGEHIEPESSKIVARPC